MNKSADIQSPRGTPVSITISSPVSFPFYTLRIMFSVRTLMMCTSSYSKMVCNNPELILLYIF